MPRYFPTFRRTATKTRWSRDGACRSAAEIEVAQLLADLAKNIAPASDRHDIQIAVRTDEGPLFKAAFIYQLAPHETMSLSVERRYLGQR